MSYCLILQSLVSYKVSCGVVRGVADKVDVFTVASVVCFLSCVLSLVFQSATQTVIICRPRAHVPEFRGIASTLGKLKDHLSFALQNYIFLDS